MADEEEVDEEFEEEYEEDYEGGSLVNAFASTSWRRVVVFPLILVLFAVGVWFLWKRNRDRVFAHHSYKLDPRNIEYTSPPDWINRDILEEVLECGSLETKGIHDEGITVQVAGAFEHHAWVKEVERVRIVYPAQLQVELSYRKPVAMVKLPPPRDPEKPQRMWPIDASAVRLPSQDFTEEFAHLSFPRIDVGASHPTGLIGSIWGDKVVEDAAKLAELLHDDWETLGQIVYRIVRSSEPTSSAMSVDFDIVGYGDDPLVVHWGRAPGKEQAGEPSAQAKINKLKEWFRQAKVEGYVPVSEIDLRSMRLLQDSLQTAKVESIRRATSHYKRPIQQAQLPKEIR